MEKPILSNRVMQYMERLLWQGEKGVGVTFRCATKVLDDYQVA